MDEYLTAQLSFENLPKIKQKKMDQLDVILTDSSRPAACVV